jgi:hypothetical protein
MINSRECTKSLIENSKSGMDIRNLSGVQAKNMGAWYPEITKTFHDYLTKVEQTLIQQSKDNKI